jgi:hypothetical protein
MFSMILRARRITFRPVPLAEDFTLLLYREAFATFYVTGAGQIAGSAQRREK